jgi:hypothetical protein
MGHLSRRDGRFGIFPNDGEDDGDEKERSNGGEKKPADDSSA